MANSLESRGKSWHQGNNDKNQICIFLQYQWEQKCNVVLHLCKKWNTNTFSICNCMRLGRIKDKFSRMCDKGNLWKLWKYKWKFILNSTRTQWDYCLVYNTEGKIFGKLSKHVKTKSAGTQNKQFTTHKQFNCCSANRTRKTDYAYL